MFYSYDLYVLKYVTAIHFTLEKLVQVLKLETTHMFQKQNIKHLLSLISLSTSWNLIVIFI